MSKPMKTFLEPDRLFGRVVAFVVLAGLILSFISLIRSKRVCFSKDLRRRLTYINRTVITNDPARRPALLRWTTQVRIGGYKEEGEPDAQ